MAEEKVAFRAAVFVIVRDENGHVLLHRRANTGYMDGYYDFPSGHVDSGESFPAAAARELREETSLQVEEASLRLKHLNLNHTDYPYITAVFDVDKWRGSPQIMEPNKCDDMRFFAVVDLPEKCTLGVRCIERAGFDTSGTTSYIDKLEFKKLIGVEFDELVR